MTVLAITCDNCGAKYKLPESFTGSQAKCQKCGSVIDVARQRAAASSPAAGPATAARPAPAKPAAAARPAIDRSKEAARPAERPAAAARTERAERTARKGRAAADDAPAEDAKGRRGRGERKKNNSMPLLLAGVGLVAIVVVVVLMMSGDKDQPAKQDAAKASGTAAAAAKPADPAPQAAPAPTPEPPPPPPPAAAAPEPPATAPIDASAGAPAPADADPTRVKRPWERLRNPPTTMDQVTDAKSYGEVKWPEGTDDARKAELRELAAAAATDGMPAVRAKRRLAEAGYLGLFAIVEQLQQLDYKAPEPSMVAGDLNKLLEEITAGLNARFEFVDATEQIPPAKAEWNTRTVKGWMDLLASIPDEETYKKGRVERLKKQADK